MVVVRKTSPCVRAKADRYIDRPLPHVLSYHLWKLCVVGHINHSLFWKNLAPSAAERKGHGGALKDGPLKTAIYERWGDLEKFKKEFNTTTAGIQGSGWGWLVRFRCIARQSVGFKGSEIDLFVRALIPPLEN